MDFGFGAEQEGFRQEVRQFLAANRPDSFPVQAVDDGYGLGAWSYEFGRQMGAQGWISMTWPKEDGGQARPMMDLLVLLEELAYAQAPMQSLAMSLPMGRTIIEFGNATLKQQFLPGIASGQTIFWLALSETQAGSDLLSLDTRAVDSGDHFVVNGQKTWSSLAHLSNYGFLIARTDPTLPRHKGLSMLILDKSLPGVTVRPLMNLAGEHYHNEVFLDNVRIPKDNLLGEMNQGFAQMLKTLEVDRFWARFIKPPFCKGVLEQLVQYCRETSRDGMLLARDPLVRHKLAESAIEIEACRLLFYRVAWMMQNQIPLSYQATGPKLLADEMGQRLFNKGMQIMGPYSQLTGESKWAPLHGRMQRWYLLATGHTLAGGSSEIMRNSLATVGLKLPRN